MHIVVSRIEYNITALGIADVSRFYERLMDCSCQGSMAIECREFDEYDNKLLPCML